MKRLAVLSLLFLTFCASGGGPGPSGPSAPGRGAISIELVPNPIVARHVSGDRYDFPFEVIVRETGGSRVTIDRVSADVLALGSIRVAQESYDARQIAALGYPTSVPANGTLRLAFNPRREVPDDRLFGGVSAEVRVEGRDEGGRAVEARTTVTVRR